MSDKLVKFKNQNNKERLNRKNTALILPAGTTAQQPDPAVPGMMRFNVDPGKEYVEVYVGGRWSKLRSSDEAINLSISEEQIYDYTADFITEGYGITIDDNDSDNTITISVTNEFTFDHEAKLDGIEENAQANVQSDWTETDTTSDTFIQNKPAITDPVQSDWTESDDTVLSYIHNKPSLFSGDYDDLSNRPTLFSGRYGDLTDRPFIPDEDDIYDYTSGFITEGTGIDLVSNDSDNTITISISNEFTSVHEAKLDGIEDGAEVNVQSNWDEADIASDAFIQNKPTLFSGSYTDLTDKPMLAGEVTEDDIYNFNLDIITDGTGIDLITNDSDNTITISVTNEFTQAHETKLDGIADGAEVNVQSDWDEVDTNSDAFIQNKPTLFSGSYNDLTDRPNIADSLTEDDIYDFNVAIISEGTGITLTDDDSGNTITISVTNEFTDAHETKLDGIEDGAQVNVQPDWDESDISSDAFIQNKPSSFLADITEDDVYEHAAAIIQGESGITVESNDSDNTITITRDSLSATDIESGILDSGRLAAGGMSGYVLTRTSTGQSWQPITSGGVTEEQVYGHNVNIFSGGDGISLLENDSDNTIIISIDSASPNIEGVESIEDAFDADINIGAAASGQQTVTQTGDLEANHYYFLTDEDDNTLTIPDDAVAIMIGIGKGNVARIRVEDLLNETEVTDGQEANELGIRLSAFALGKGTANISDQILIGHGSSRELAVGTTGDDVDGTPLIIQWVTSITVSTSSQGNVTRDDIYDHASDIITSGSGIILIENDSDNTITISVENEFTDAHETKLDGIADGAEVNVQSDWDEVDISSDAFIQNKPTLFSGSYDDLTDKPMLSGEVTEDDIYDYNLDIIAEGSGITLVTNDSDNTITISVTNEFTQAHETKLDGIADGAEVNVQSDWDEIDISSDSFIQNKPTLFSGDYGDLSNRPVLFSGDYNDLINTPSISGEITDEDVYGHNLNIIMEGTGIDLITNDSDSTITISVTNEFTQAHETKLDSIDDNAQVNVQSDWSEIDTTSDAFIQNKPTLFSGSYTDLTDTPSIPGEVTEDDIFNYTSSFITNGTGIAVDHDDSGNTITISVTNEFTDAHETKLDGIADGAEVNVQSDWGEVDISSDAFIQNKPTLFSGDYDDLSNKPIIPDAVTEDDIYNYNLNIIASGDGITIAVNDSDNTITIIRDALTDADIPDLDTGKIVSGTFDSDRLSENTGTIGYVLTKTATGQEWQMITEGGVSLDQVYSHSENIITNGSGIDIVANDSDNTITISVANEFTQAHETKLYGIADGAEVNVQSDWDEADISSDAFIQNKPALFSGSYTDLTDRPTLFSGDYDDLINKPNIAGEVTEDDIYGHNLNIITEGTGIDLVTNDSDNTITISVTNEFTAAHETKLDGIEDNAQANIQSDWSEVDTNSDAFIQNKPTLFSGDYGDLTNTPSIPSGVTEDDVYNYTSSFITNGTGVTIDHDDSGNTITISVTNEFTQAHETKLDGIADGAEVNVQPNWDEVDTTSDAFIQNKPTIIDPVQSDWDEADDTQLSYIQNKPTLFSGSYNDLSDRPNIADALTEDDIYSHNLNIIAQGLGISLVTNDSDNTITISVTNEFTDAYETKLAGIADGAEVNVQSDWDEADISSDAFIQNKPTLFSGSYTDLTDKPVIAGNVTEDDIYTHNLNIITEGSGIDLVANDSDNTITISVTNEFTAAHETKLSGIADGAEVNVQSNWDEADTTSDAFIQNKPTIIDPVQSDWNEADSTELSYIQNKPTLFSGSYTDLTDIPSIPSEVTEDDVYNYTSSFITNGNGITVDADDSSNTITISVTNEFTQAHETKLDGIEDGAEVNIQSDWDEADISSDAFIQNKPTLFSGDYDDLINKPIISGAITEDDIYDYNLDIITSGTGIELVTNDSDNTITISVTNEFTDAHETKLAGIADGAEVNVQSDWTEADNTSDAFIQNKPTLFSGDYGDLTNTPSIPSEVTEDDIYNYTSSFITNGTGITVDDDDSGNTITISVTNEFTQAHETKLDGIADGAEVNVQSDWGEVDISSDAFIQNKPTLFSGSYNDLTDRPTLFSGDYNDLSNKPSIAGEITDEDVYGHNLNVIMEGTGIDLITNDSDNTITIAVTNEFTDAHETKLDGIETGAEVNVQSDWSEVDTNSDAFIQNKPSLFSGSYTDLTDTPSIPSEIMEDDIFNYTSGFITDGTGVTIDHDDSGNTITISVTNEFTQAHETKLDGIADGAEVNVQSDWNEADISSDAFIQNKPSLFSGDYGDLSNRPVLFSGSYNDLSDKPIISGAITEDDIYGYNLDIITEGTGINLVTNDSDNTITISVTNEFTQAHENKLDGIETGAEVNVQSDWDEVDTNSDAFIQNKPSLFSGDYGDLTNVPSIPNEVTEDDLYNYTAGFITDGAGITIDDDDSGNTITISVTNEFTNVHETKLAGIADGAEVNVQSDWTETDINSDAFIQNKPTLFSGDYGDLSNRPTLFSGSYTDLTDIPSIPDAVTENDIYTHNLSIITEGTGVNLVTNDSDNTITISVTNEFTHAHENKLDGIETGAEVNVQSDWDEIDISSDAFIQNKPSLFSGDYGDLSNRPILFSGDYGDLTNRPSIPGEDDVYDYMVSFVTVGNGINLATNDSDNTITLSIENEFTQAHETKLDGIEDNAQENVRSDWNEMDINSDSFIQNKPSLFSGSYDDLSDKPMIPDEDDTYDYVISFITEGAGIDLVTNDSANLLTISVTNEFTQAHETKLDGIEDGAEVNVQADWNENDISSDTYIHNKPTLFSGDYDDLINKPIGTGGNVSEDDIYNYTAGFITNGSGIDIDTNDSDNTITISVSNEFTSAHETKLAGIETGAEVNVQSDWTETDTNSDAFIQNKPTITDPVQSDWTEVDNTQLSYIQNKPTLFSGDYGDLSNRPTLFSGSYNDLTDRPNISGGVTDEDVYGHNIDIIMAGTGIDLITNDSDNTITISVSNEFTSAHETKLDGIETGAEVNVQSDWTETDTSLDTFIQNKPTLFSGDYDDLSNRPTLFSGSYDDLTDKPVIDGGVTDEDVYNHNLNIIMEGTGIDLVTNDSDNTITISVTNEFTQAHETKLDGIADGAEVNVQSDWTEADNTSDAFIQNKPTLFSGSYNDLTDRPNIADALTEDDIYAHNANIIMGGMGISLNLNDSDNTITIDRDSLVESDIPGLDTSKIISGEFDTERLSLGGEAGQVLTKTINGHNWQDVETGGYIELFDGFIIEDGTEYTRTLTEPIDNYTYISISFGANRGSVAETLRISVDDILTVGNEDQLLYAVDTDTDKLYQVDETTGSTTLVGPLVGSTYPAGLTSHNGLLYGIDSTTEKLYIINPADGFAREISGLGGLTSTRSLASHNGTLYTADITTSKLYTLSISGGIVTSTEVGDLGITIPQALASHNGTLYLTSSNTDSLYTVDISDGSTTLVGSLGIARPNALASYEGTLYVADTEDDKLYTVDTSDGSTTEVGDLGITNIEGLTSHISSGYMGPWIRIEREDDTTLKIYAIRDGYISEIVGIAGIDASTLGSFGVTESDIYEHNINIINEGTGIDLLLNDSDNTITISVENEFTDAHETKLDGIEDGAEVNVQSDWDEVDTTSDAFIQNKPALFSGDYNDLINTPSIADALTEDDIYDYTADFIMNGAGITIDENNSDNTITISVTNEFTSAHETKLAGIANGAEVNVQSDWNEVDVSSDAFIQNKPTLFSGDYGDLSNRPTLFSGDYNDLINTPSITGETTDEDIYTHNLNVITEGTGIDLVTNDSDSTITISVTNEFTQAHETKLDGIADGAEVNVQSDWAETDTTVDSFIQNKPSLFSGDYGDLTNTPSIPVEDDIYNYTASFITNGAGITIDDDDSGNTITISVTNEFTDAHETKLDGIADGAEVNVQSDWSEVDVSSDAFIQNKPTLFSGSYNDLTDRPNIADALTESDIYDFNRDIITNGTGIDLVTNDSDNTITISITNEFTQAHETKLDGIEDGAEVNVQSDWDEIDTNSDAFIQNKPSLFSGDYNDLTNRPTIADEITEEDIYEHNANIIMGGTGITLNLNDSDNTITIDRDSLTEGDIPGLDTSKIISGEFDTERLASGGEPGQVLTRLASGHNWRDPDNSGYATLFDGFSMTYREGYSLTYSEPLDNYEYVSLSFGDNENNVSETLQISIDNILSTGSGEGTLYVVGNNSDSNPALYTVNVSDGSATEVGEIGILGPMAFHNGSLYIIEPGTDDTLHVLNLSDLSTTEIGVLGTTTPGGFASHDGMLYVTDTSDDKLYTVDIHDASITEVGDLTTSNVSGLTSHDGNLYSIDASSNSLNRLDISDGSTAESWALGITLPLGVISYNGIFYITSATTDSLYSYDTDSATSVLIGALGVDNAVGLELYVTSGYIGDWVQIERKDDDTLRISALQDGYIHEIVGIFESRIFGDDASGHVTEEQVYDHVENIIMDGTGIDIVSNESDNTITISVTNEFTAADETKLDGIEIGAEVNVQPDWSETDTNSDAFIQNKPTLFSGDYDDLSNTPSIPGEDDIYDYTADFITGGTGIIVDENNSDNTITISVANEFTDIHETKLDGIADGAEVNVQSDWDEVDINSDAFIQNKPTLFSGSYDDLTDKPVIDGGVTDEDVYNHNLNIITNGNGIDIDANDSDNTITISVSNEFTQVHETKLDGIADGAEVNVQSDWDEVDTTSDAFIQNKPTLFSGSYNDLTDKPVGTGGTVSEDDVYDYTASFITEGTGIDIVPNNSDNTITISVTNEFTAVDAAKLAGIDIGAEVNVQANWDEADIHSDTYIQNKPIIPDEDNLYEFTASFITEGTGITIDDDDSGNTLTIAVTNEFTTTHETKLDGIEDNAQVNVQSDWDEIDTTSDAFIQNKPNIPDTDELYNHTADFIMNGAGITIDENDSDNTITISVTNEFTDVHEAKLAGIDAGAEVNVQANWDESDSNSDTFIQNKPTLFSGDYNDLINTPSIAGATTDESIYLHNVNIITEGTGITLEDNDSDNTITISVTNEFTDVMAIKLAGIDDGAEINVQSNWNETDHNSDAFIQNKPIIPDEDSIYDNIADVLTEGSGIILDERDSDNTITISVANEFTDAHETKLDGIADGAEVNVQSDWAETDTTVDSFIQNKPSLFSGDYNDLTNNPFIPDENDIYDYTAGFIMDGNGITITGNDSDNTLTITRDDLLADDIPELDTDKITTGEFDSARLSSGGEDGQVLTRTASGHTWEYVETGGYTTLSESFSMSIDDVYNRSLADSLDNYAYLSLSFGNDEHNVSETFRITVDSILDVGDGTGTLYIIEEDSGKLYTIDPSDASTTEVGNLGLDSPKGIAQHGGVLYVVDADTDKIYTVNPDNASTTEVGDLGITDPAGLASHAGILYVVDGSGDHLYIVDTSDGSTTDIGDTAIEGPQGLTSYKGKLYVVNINDDKIYSLDTNTGRVYGDLGIESPRGVTSLDGTMYIVDGTTDNLFMVDDETGIAEEVGNLGILGPNALAAHNGTLYVADTSTDKLYTVSTSDGSTTEVGTLGVSYPTALASHNGTLYIIDGNTDNLYTVDTSDGSTTSVGNTGRALATGLASHNGTLYTVDVSNDKLYTVDTSDGSTTEVTELTEIANPAGMTSHNGDLYVIDTVYDRLYRINLDTGDIFGTLTGTDNIRGVAAYNGELYITDYSNGNLYTMDIDSGEITEIGSTGLTNPSGMAAHVTNGAVGTWVRVERENNDELLIYSLKDGYVHEIVGIFEAGTAHTFESIQSGSGDASEDSVHEHASNIITGGEGITVDVDDSANTITITRDELDASDVTSGEFDSDRLASSGTTGHVLTKTASGQTWQPITSGGATEEQVYGHNVNIISGGTGIDIDTDDVNNTITISLAGEIDIDPTEDQVYDHTANIIMGADGIVVDADDSDNTVTITLDMVSSDQLATGGDTGQVLTKTDDGHDWQDASSSGGGYVELSGAFSMSHGEEYSRTLTDSLGNYSYLSMSFGNNEDNVLETLRITVDSIKDINEEESTMYILDADTDKLYSVDPATATTTEIGDTGLIVPLGLEYHDGVLYTVDNDNDSLYSVDISTGTATLIGELGISTPQALASFHGELYVADASTDKLYIVDTTDGSTTESLDLTGIAIPQAMATHNGTLYISDTSTDMIYSVDVTPPFPTDSPGLFTIVGDLGIASPQAMTSYKGTLYITDTSTDKLYTVNTTNGSTTEVGSLGLESARAIATSVTSGYAGDWVRIEKQDNVTLRVISLQDGYVHEIVGVLDAGMSASSDTATTTEEQVFDHSVDIIKAGDGIEISTDDSDNTITISSTSGGGGGYVTLADGFSIESPHEYSTSLSDSLDNYAYLSLSFGNGEDSVLETLRVTVESILDVGGGTGTLYLISEGSGDGTVKGSLYTVDISDGSTTLVGNTDLTSPRGIAYHEGDLYVIDQNSDKLYTVDTSDGSTTEVGSGELGMTAPTGLASHNGTLYAVDSTTDALYTVDISDGSATSIGDLEINGAHGLTSYDGKLYVVDISSDRLYEVNTNSGSVMGSLPGITVPRGIASHEGTMYIVDNSTDKLFTYDFDSGEVEEVGDLGIIVPVGLTSHNGELYVANSSTRGLYTVNTSNASVTEVGINSLQGPNGLASHEGTLYIVDSYLDKLHTISATDASTTEIGDLGIFGPTGLASHEGTLYVVDAGTDKIYTVDTSDGSVSEIGDGDELGISNPNGLTSHDGKLYVVDSSDDRLYEVDVSTGVIVAENLGGLRNVRGIATYGGEIYVADVDTVKIYTVDISNRTNTEVGSLGVSNVSGLGAQITTGELGTWVRIERENDTSLRISSLRDGYVHEIAGILESENSETEASEANVQSDWDETDTTSDAYIQNKPDLFSGSYDDLTDVPDLEPTEDQVYDHVANILAAGTGITITPNDSDNTITIEGEPDTSPQMEEVSFTADIHGSSREWQHSDTKPSASSRIWTDDGWSSSDSEGWSSSIAQAGIDGDSSEALWIQYKSWTRGSDGTYTLSDTSITAAWAVQYSDDGESWHDTQEDDDTWIRWRDNDGEWAVSRTADNNDWVNLLDTTFYRTTTYSIASTFSVDLSRYNELLIRLTPFAAWGTGGETYQSEGPTTETIMRKPPGFGWPVDTTNDSIVRHGRTYLVRYDWIDGTTINTLRDFNANTPSSLHENYQNGNDTVPAKTFWRMKFIGTTGQSDVTSIRGFGFGAAYARFRMQISGR